MCLFCHQLALAPQTARPRQTRVCPLSLPASSRFPAVLSRSCRRPGPRRRRIFSFPRHRASPARTMPDSSPPHYSSVVAEPVGFPAVQPAVQPNAQSSNASVYTLHTIPGPSNSRPQTPDSFRTSLESDRAPLLPSSSSTMSTYGSVRPTSPGSNISSRKLLLNAGIKMAAVFILSTIFLGGTLWLALPTLEE